MGTKLEAIAKGKLKKVFISEMKNYTKEIVSEIKSSDKNINMTTFQRSLVQTAKPMLEVNGKKAKCLYAKIVNVVTVKCIRTTNARAAV